MPPPSMTRTKPRAPVAPLLGVVALLVLWCFGYSLLEVPRVRLFEKVICERYYADKTHNVAAAGGGLAREERCKVPAVQTELAMVAAYKLCLDGLPAILTASYYGHWADKYGRKNVAMLAFLGEYLSLLWQVVVCWYGAPIKLIWLSTSFLLLGGGVRVYLSMLFSMITDLVHPDLRTRFLYLGPGVGAICGICAPPVTAALMDMNVYVPFACVLVGSLATFLILMAMHETSETVRSGFVVVPPLVDEAAFGPVAEEVTPLILPSKTFEPLDARDYQTSQTRSRPTSAARRDDDDVEEDEGQKNSLTSRVNPALSSQLVLVYAMFFIKRTGLLSLQIFTWQYVSVAGAFSVALMTIVILPLISTFAVRRYPIRPVRLDQVICIVSALIFTGGFTFIWAAKTIHAMYLAIVITSLAQGLEAALQGIAIYLAPKEYTARVFTIIAMMDAAAKIIGGPVVIHFITSGGAGSQVSGLCFLLSGMLYVVVAATGCVLNISRNHDD